MSGKSSDQYQIYRMPRERFSTTLPNACPFFPAHTFKGQPLTDRSCGALLNALSTLLSPTAMAEIIIMLTIKCKLCSWRSFHPDAQCVTLNFYYNKSSCSHLLLFAYFQEAHLFSQTKKFCKKCSLRFTKHF